MPGPADPPHASRFRKAALIPQTMDLLAAEEHERGRVVVLVLDFSDEGHLLGRRPTRRARAPEQQRVDSHSPFACLLVGQPTLRRRIKLGMVATRYLDRRCGRSLILDNDFTLLNAPCRRADLSCAWSQTA